jgi:hypothetical protein
MAFKKGESRPENAGRKKGSVNQKTKDARELADKLGVDPLEILFHFASRNWKALGYASEYHTKVLKDGGTLEVERITPEMRLNAAKEAVRYVYPQTKAVELKANEENGTGFKIVLEDYTKKD